MMLFVAWVGTFAALLTSFGIIWKKLVKPVIQWAMRLDKAVGFVEAQMVPNGGTSLRDSLNRIEVRMTLLEDYVTRAR